MWSYILLGIIQGIFEWLPISSEGVTALATHFLIKSFNPVDLALFLHLGTFFAVLIYFRKDWKEILTFKNPKLLRFLIIATTISLIISYPLYKLIRSMVLGNGLLLIMGIGLLATAYFHKKNISFKINLKYLAIISGFLQGLSVIPGLSRSGATIFGLSLAGIKPEKILKLSYLMSAPVVLAATCYLILQDSTLVFKAWPALVSSFLIGILTLHFLINWAKKIDFFKFALIFSIICFLGAILGFVF